MLNFSIQSPIINGITRVPRGMNYSWKDKIHYATSNAKLVGLTLVGVGLDAIRANMTISKKVMSLLVPATTNAQTGIVDDDSDAAFLDRRFNDTFSLWIKRLPDDQSYLLDLSDKALFADLSYTTGASFLRCQCFFTHTEIRKIVLLDNHDREFTYTPQSTDHWRWMICKAYVDSACIQLNVHHHVLFGHRLTQWYNACLMIPAMKAHPLKTFLEGYFDKTVALFGLTRFFGIDVFYDVDLTISHLDTQSMHIFHERLLRSLEHQDLARLDIQSRLRHNNLSDPPSYYGFAQTILADYNIERRLVEDVLDGIFPSDDSVIQDTCLSEFWHAFHRGCGMVRSPAPLTKSNLTAMIMVLVSIILDHSMEHATTDRSFCSAFRIPLRVKETKADLSGLDNPKQFFFDKVIGGSTLAFSQAGLALGYSTHKLPSYVQKQYRMWGTHTPMTSILSRQQLDAYQKKLDDLQTHLLANGLENYCKANLPMSVRD